MKIFTSSVLAVIMSLFIISGNLYGFGHDDNFCFDADVPEAQLDLQDMCLTAPFIMCPSTYLGCPNENTAPSNTGQAAATPGDPNCPQPTLTFSDVIVTNTPCLQVIHRTWEAGYTGAANIKLHSSCQQTLFLEDTTAPVISNCPGNMNINLQNNCSGIATWSIPTAADNCGIQSFTTTHFSGTAFATGTTTVTYTATDNCGFQSVCTFNVSVSGSCCAGPSITCPSNFASCGGSTEPSVTGVATGTNADPSSCGAVNVIFTDVLNSTSTCGSVITRTWVASDNTASASCVQTINTSDSNIPVISNVPSDMTLTGNGVNCSVPVTWAEPIATDNCGISSFTSNLSSGNVFSQGSTLVTYTAIDNCGNQTTAAFQVTINCTQPCNTNPSISCPGTYNACPSTGVPSTSISGIATATSTGGCSGSPIITHSDVINNPGNGACAGSQQILRTFTATDPSNPSLSASCSQSINLLDTQAPTIVGLPSNMSVNGTGTGCSVPVTWTVPTATDNCGVSSLTSNFQPGHLFTAGSTTVIYTAVDNCGNVSTLSFTVTVSCVNLTCNTPPSISCPSSFSSCPTSGVPGPNVTGSATAVATGSNCGTPTITFNDIISGSGVCAQSQVIQRTWTATEPSSGLTSSCVQMINLVDNTNPFFQTFCPGPISISGTGANCSAVAVWTVPTAADNCSSVSLSSTHNSGSTFSQGSTLVTYTATDNCGNASTCAFNVTVNCVTCNTNPVISCPASLTACIGSSSSPSITGTATASAGANCPTPTVTFSDSTTPSGACGGSVITRTWSASYPGVNGFSASCVQNINLIDQIKPTITGCPSDLTINGSNIPVTWVPPTATDNCSVPQLTSTHNSGSVFSQGTTTVIYTATDNCGNTTSCSFNVTVILPQGGFATCPDDITVTCSSSGGAVATWPIPTYNGACTSCDNGGYIAGFIYMGSFNGSQYYCSLNPATWNNAKSIATSHGGYLADVTTAAENAYLANQLQTNSAWIGLSDYGNEGNFTWCSGAPFGSYTNWYPGQPNNYNGTQDYVELLSDGTWNDQYNSYALEFIMEIPCSFISQTQGPAPGTRLQSGTYPVTYTVQDACGTFATCSFTVTVNSGLSVNCPSNINVTASSNAGTVCSWNEPTAQTCCSNCSNTGGSIPGFVYMGSFNGSHYYCSLSPASWATARQNCVNLGGDLAVINSAGENAFLANGLLANSAWVGATDSNSEGSFQWVDNSPFSYTNWYIGQPNNYNGSQDHLELLKSGEWNDQYGSVSLEYILEVSNCITTTQTAGPTSGTVCPPGVHTVSYRVQDGCGNVETCSFNVTVTGPTPPPSSGFCASGGTFSTNSHIKSFAFNTITNVSGNNSGYKDFTNLCTTVSAGTAYPLQLTPGFGGATPVKVYWTCWIDYNMDGDFNDNYEFVAYGCGPKTLSGTVTIPYNVWNGTARMRCTMSVGGYVTDPCAIYQYGETEDYCVKITGADFTGKEGQDLELRKSPWSDATELTVTASDDHFVNIYPNPVNQIMTLEVGNTDLLNTVTIYSIDGQRVRTLNNVREFNEVNVSDLQGGIYMLNAIYEDGTEITERIIVQH